MSKFTAGEWEADDWGKHVYTRSDKYFEPIAQMQEWSFLTGTNGLNLTAEEAIEMQKANARLIAAAPEMYKLLTAVANYKPDIIWDVVFHAKELLLRIDGKEAANE